MQLNIPLETPTTLKEEKSPNERLDFSFFLEPPELSISAILTIDALAPLSMNTEQPGTYYQSLSAPTDTMLFGMFENALGWHLSNSDREQILKGLRTIAKKQVPKKSPWLEHDWLLKKSKDMASNSGFFSLLSFHIDMQTTIIPSMLRFDDLWSRHVHSNDTMYPNGSRNHDYRMDKIQTMKRQQLVAFSDRADVIIKSEEQLADIKQGDTIHPNVTREHYPLYYASPTPREYVELKRPFQFCMRTTKTLFNLLQNAFKNPFAPLYLGHSEGWVEAKLEERVC